MKEFLKKHRLKLTICAAAAVLIIAVVIFFAARGCSGASYKVLLEWDFSKGMGDFSGEGYYADASLYEIVSEGPDGSNCARITSAVSNDARFKVTVPVKPNSYYKVTAKVRTANVESPGKAAGANISALYSYEYKGGLVGDNDWTDLTVYGKTSSGQTEAQICFRLGFYSCDTTGTAWFDDIKIEQLPKLPSGASAISFEQTMLNNGSGNSGATTVSQRDLVEQYYDGIKIGMLIVITAFLFFAVMYRYGVLRDRDKRNGIERVKELLVPIDYGDEDPVIYDENETRSGMPELSETAEPAENGAAASNEASADSAVSEAEGAVIVPETAETPEKPFKPLFKTVKVGYRGLNTGAAIIILLTLGLIFRLIASVTAPQCSIDVSLFQSWGKHIVADGIPKFYANAASYSLDYPPLYMYFLWFNTLLAKWFGLTGTAGHVMLTKLPSILADIGIGWILYKMTAKKLSKNWTIFFVALWVMNPLSMLDSAAWGQVDSILALLCLLMVWFIVKDRYILASVMFGLAVILKPQGIFMLPIIGYALLRRLIKNKDVPRGKTAILILKCILTALGTIVIVALPFGILMKPNFFEWLFNLYVGTANGYKGATVNSYNFYYIIRQNWTVDSNKFIFGMSYLTFGMLMIVVSCIIVMVMYLLTKRSDKSMPFLYSATLIYMVTMFGPRMHERYFFPCAVLLLAAVLYSNNKILLWIYGVLTGVNFMSVLSVMLGLEIGGKLKDAGATQDLYGSFYWAAQEPHRRVIAILNLVCCLALIAAAVLYTFNVKFMDDRRLRIYDTEDDADEL